MTWEHIPNEVVVDFMGKPIRMPMLDANLEVIYKPMKCPGPRNKEEPPCALAFTNLTAYGEHLMDVHGYPSTTAVDGQLLQEDATVARLIMALLLVFNNESRDNPMRFIYKTNDPSQSSDTWRRAFLALSRKESEVRLKKEQYDWLHGVLGRKLPMLPPPGMTLEQAKEQGMEQQTVALTVFRGSTANVLRAFTLPAARKPLEANEPEDVSLSPVKQEVNDQPNPA